MMIDVDDQTISSLGKTTGPPRAPLATAPRGVCRRHPGLHPHGAPGKRAPRAVIVDVDFATPTPGDEAGGRQAAQGAGRLGADALGAASDAGAPGVPGLRPGGGTAPRSSCRPPILTMSVVPAPNIFWSQVKMMADQDGVVREFLPYECGAQPGVVRRCSIRRCFWPTVFLQNGGDSPRLTGQGPGWTRPKTDCTKAQAEPVSHGEVDQLSSVAGQGARTPGFWPDVPADWKGFAVCGPGGGFGRCSAGFRPPMSPPQAPDASHDLLCGRLVIVGGTNGRGGRF